MLGDSRCSRRWIDVDAYAVARELFDGCDAPSFGSVSMILKPP